MPIATPGVLPNRIEFDNNVPIIPSTQLEIDQVKLTFYPTGSLRAAGFGNRIISLDTSKTPGSNPSPAPDFNNEDVHRMGVHIFATNFVAASGYKLDHPATVFYLSIF